MNQEQFAHCWGQLKQYVPAKWTKVTEEDVRLIDGNLATFNTVVEGHYGPMKDDPNKWAHRWNCHWTGKYEGYQEALVGVSNT
jgi:hypothetical protein